MTTTPTSRRRVLQQALLSCGLLSIGPTAAWARTLPPVPANRNAGTGLQAIVGPATVGQLLEPDANGIRLPAGFSSRLVARSSQAVASTGYVWHAAPDGGACFADVDGGWIYVSNAEVGSGGGGVSAIRFDVAGNITAAYSICSGSSRNCAGGPTPWGTWLTCEEVDLGRVIECDPRGVNAPQVRNALGWLDHEAAAIDPTTGFVYLTEDRSDGRLYRFRPSVTGNLAAGVLEVARLAGSGPWDITWQTVPNPNPSGSQKRTRRQVQKSTAFNGGEGAWYHNGVVYLTTKGDNRVWALATGTNRIAVVYDDNTSPTPILTGVDNVTVSSVGTVFVAEDGGDMQICVVGSAGDVAPLLKVEGQGASEITGPAFSPDGSRLYFSSQRGTSGTSAGGITYEVSGPFTTV